MKTLFDENLTLEEAKELIKNGADVNEKDDGGKTPIFYANTKKLVQYLIETGANVNHKDHYGLTPLCHDINIKIARTLIKNGADVNALDGNHYTPLHGARSPKIIKLLVEHGANINARSKDNESVLDCYSNMKTLKLLISYGAIFSELDTYKMFSYLFNDEQKNAFDTFAMLASCDDDFFHMCLAYQDGIKNNIKLDVTDMDIL